MSTKLPALDQLIAELSGPVLTRDDADYAGEIAPFNRALTVAPDVVVGAETEGDVLAAVRYAKANGLPVSVQATGHGGYVPITSGLLVTTKRLDRASVDPETGIATVGAGVQAGAALKAADPHGWFPIAGTSGTVGLVGLVLGGGLGPFARSHGFASDYLLGATVVTGSGELVEANSTENSDLFWALRGGKKGLGIVTEARIQLVRLDGLYAGSLMFDAPAIETALRAWVDWTATADPRVNTSIAILHMPPVDAIPAPLRGRTLLSLRFAFPGSTEEGERLATPLRAAAPVYMDMLGELPPADFARIHNDPAEPEQAVSGGGALKHVDQSLVTAFLGQVGPDTTTPFIATEIRHLGAATAHDVPEGSAAGPRGAGFIYNFASIDRSQFATGVPAAAEALREALAPWAESERNVHFNGTITSEENYKSLWSPETFAKLQEIRERYDPDGLFQVRF